MKKNKFESKLSASGPSYLPLYKQVEEYITQLIVEQRWKPGEMLPNEFQLADELNVSQGTVRKALNTLTTANILKRKQGVGTFVSEHTGNHALYRFFPIVADGHAPELPMSETIERRVELAQGEVATSLALTESDEVIVLSRRRKIRDEMCILEDIYLPKQYFEALMDEPEIPHTLYHFYQTKYNHTVHDISDRIKAILATQADAETLDVNVGDPLLMFVRLAKTLTGQVIEYRVTRCRSDHYHYLVNQI